MLLQLEYGVSSQALGKGEEGAGREIIQSLIPMSKNQRRETLSKSNRVHTIYRVPTRLGFLLSHIYHNGTLKILCQVGVPKWYLRCNMEKSKKLKQESDSLLDALRIERTTLTQDEFAYRCGIPRTTYLRWISGRTEARPTLPQLKKICRELKIERVEELPDDFGPQAKN